MIFLSSIFLWALGALSVPIILAILSRRRRKSLPFGAYFILQKLMQTHSKRWRLTEILKLINRLIFISLLVIVFANPQVKRFQYTGIDDGFVLLMDTGRIMQMKTESGEVLGNLGFQKLKDHLAKIPGNSRGTILFVSDRCDVYEKNKDSIRRATDWISDLRYDKIPFANTETSSGGLNECLQKANSFFGSKKIFATFVSSFPDSLGKNTLDQASLVLDSLPAPKMDLSEIVVQENYNAEKVRIELIKPTTLNATLIKTSGTETLGSISNFIDLAAMGDSWLWLHNSEGADPWTSEKVIGIKRQKNFRITLWAQKESPGFLSLYTALKNYPDLVVVRQIGEQPETEPVIIYGPTPPNLGSLKQAWIFLDLEASRPFVVRDQKVWASQSKNTDAEKAFHIQTQDGRIFIKRYLLLDVDRMQSLEAFEDGAPSLMSDGDGRWISTFDLEDLTTDLTLEPTFIPYLYRKLDQFLALHQTDGEQVLFEPFWVMPGSMKPTKEVLEEMRWPGIYKGQYQFKIVEPIALPKSFLEVPKKSKNAPVVEEELISIRENFLKALILSGLLELFLCLLATFRQTRRIAAAVLLGLLFGGMNLNAASSEIRPINLGIMKGMDPDRLKSLEQVVLDFGRLSNLEFGQPRITDISDIWKYAVVVISAKSWGPFSREDRETIRDYCDRGGFIIFDDPLATADSSFYRSVSKELLQIFPGRPLTAVPKESVLFRTYYLLNEVSGRKLASPHLEGIQIDRRWAVIFSFNDLLGAFLRSSNGDYAFSVTPYGISQRNLARRLFLNLMMYSVTLDYKDDAIHLPHILKRRVK